MTRPLLLMVILEIIFLLLFCVCSTGGGPIKFFGYFISAALCVLDLIVIISYLCTTVVLKADNAKTTVRCTFVIVLVIILGIALTLYLNPLRRSEEKIREKMLELTPIGTSMEDVVKVVEGNNKWEIAWISYDRGYIIQEPGKPRTTIGEKSIRVFIGEYPFGEGIFTTAVTVFWGFDENIKLIDVWVWKTTDSL